MFNVADLKVGQEVAVVRASGYTTMWATYATVEKINKFGHITLSDGQKFNKFGREYKVERNYKYLGDAEEIRARIAKETADRADQQAIRQITDDIQKKLNAHRNGYGRVFLTAEVKQELLDLINQLPITA